MNTDAIKCALAAIFAAVNISPVPEEPMPLPTVEVIELVQFSDEIGVMVTVEDKALIEDKLQDYESDFEILAKLIYREARRSTIPTHEKAAVVWNVLNRVDNDRWADTISGVVKQRNQYAWVPKTPVQDRFYDLSKDVVTRWLLEKEGYENVGRVLPQDYYFFACHNTRNRFRKEYKSRTYWDWSLPSPYED